MADIHSITYCIRISVTIFSIGGKYSMKFSYVSDVDRVALSFHLVHDAFLEVDGVGVDVAVRDEGEQREEDDVGG